ncbi:hypothetical protein [Streptomyces sp. NPDC048603]|uniref:hypothetical protein n=1 Tax=Streptomyces sp. NPDC048603 TaxID=3365577 RepID=UPI0037162D61
MGMYVLYGAFGLVALWLLAEVLLQYKARLRWRLLAFSGFLGVVAGVILPSVLVIGAGAAAFAVGQTLVTLSFRKGFVAGWALRRNAPEEEPPAAAKRRRGTADTPAAALRVSDLAYGAQGAAGRPGSQGDEAGERPEPAFFRPEPLPEDTGSYGIQSLRDRDQGPGQGQSPGQGAGQGFGPGAGFAPDSGGFAPGSGGFAPGSGGFAPGSGGFAPAADPAQTAPFASPFTTAEQDAHQYAAYYDPQTQGGYDYAGGYQTGGEQQVYAAYSDPYIGTAGVDGSQSYGYGDPYQQYGQYSTDTPPGGVWVPQQRSTDAAQPDAYPQQWPGQEQYDPQQYPYRGTDEYEQYRY